MDSTSINSKVTSGANTSVWINSSPDLRFEKLAADLTTDVLIIGGGIAGITTAYCLAKSGKKVVVLEDGYLGSGETGRTTAHLTAVLDERYLDLEEQHGTEKAGRIGKAHRMAIDWMDKTVREEQIHCHFKRINGYLFTHPSDDEETLRKEFEATIRVGFPTKWLPAIPAIAGEEGKKCILFPDQGQLHSLLYLEGLANAIIRMGGKIFTESKAESVTETGAVANGFHVQAASTVITTYSPVGNTSAMYSKQWPYRSYVIAATIPKGKLPAALWWDTGDMDAPWTVKPYHYVRLEVYDDTHDLLIAGGEDHRTGQADKEDIPEEDRYARVYAWAKQHFPDMGEVKFSWSGQIQYSIDGLGFVGKNPEMENSYIITGDSGNGMTYSTIGAQIICDQINGKSNEWADLYDPSRKVVNHTRNYLKELGNMAAQYLDWFTPGDIREAAELEPGEGAVMRSGLKKIAIYRDEQNKLHAFSAVCTYSGSILQWNADEKSFDCPVHGSRYATDGKVINGPAIENLEQLNFPDEV